MIYSNDSFSLEHNRITQQPVQYDWANMRGISTAEAHSVQEIRCEEWDSERRIPRTGIWKLTRDISHLPRFTSGSVLHDAVYNLSLEELLLLGEADGTWRTGKLWHGVWTRDVSYSTVLALALLDPQRCKTSLRKKIRNGMIVQDTGTGGSWPCSTDRMTWVLAAWEVYLVTGDRSWLEECYPVIAASATVDGTMIRDRTTGLWQGESSFLDWRSQSYPEWMDDGDIFRSLCLGTNAVHQRTLHILSRMAAILSDRREMEWTASAASLKTAMQTHLWNDATGVFDRFLYGKCKRSRLSSPEALGESLCILFGIAGGEQAQKIVANMPVGPYGPACFLPHIPGKPPYHNNAIWPFVTAYWTWAAGRAGNMAAVTHGLASLIRTASLFLTNKENMTSLTGEKEYTRVNSDRQLWSVAGQLAGVYRTLFGMETLENGLRLSPVVPAGFGPRLELSHFVYRNAVWQFTIEGEGCTVERIEIDGKPAAEAFVPGDMAGDHVMRIVLAPQQEVKPSGYRLEPARVAPGTPIATLVGSTLCWKQVGGAVSYAVFRDTEKTADVSSPRFEIPISGDGCCHEWQVESINEQGDRSFRSEPVWEVPADAQLEIASFKGGEPLSQAEKDEAAVPALRLGKTTPVSATVDVVKAGEYWFSFQYAMPTGYNGQSNLCGIRKLFIDDIFIESIVFPQLGTDVGRSFKTSSGALTALAQGTHLIELRFDADCENMNGEQNDALISEVRLQRMK